MSDASGGPPGPAGGLALADIDEELAGTRRMLERVPGESLDWRPHEKSWTLGELATHVTNLLRWQAGILRSDEYDLAVEDERPGVPPDPDALLERFDAAAAELRTALADADDASLGAPWTLRDGEEEIFTVPRLAAFRSAGVSHMVHHRGQLSVYLRLLDVPVPGVYGPSADEESGEA